MGTTSIRARLGKLTLIVATCAGALFVSCATTYQEQGFTGGYDDMPLNEQVYRVSFNGNGYTSRDDAYLFFLTRGAEIAKEKGYDHFYLVASTDNTTQSQMTTPGQSQTTTTGNIQGTYYDQGNTGQLHGQVSTTSTTTYTPPQVYNITKPAFSGQILLVEQQIEDAPPPFNADMVLEQGLERNEEVRTSNTIWGVIFWGSMGALLIGLAGAS